jgi:hypothetical protein
MSRVLTQVAELRSAMLESLLDHFRTHPSPHTERAICAVVSRLTEDCLVDDLIGPVEFEIARLDPPPPTPLNPDP